MIAALPHYPMGRFSPSIERATTGMRAVPEAPSVRDAWSGFESHPGQIREVFEESSLLLPELDILGRIHFHHALRDALHPDVHGDSYEIHYLLNGGLNWWVEDKAYEFGAGSAMVIRAGERHGAWNDVLQPCHKFWLRVRLGDDKLMPGLSADEQRRIKAVLDGLSQHVVPVSNRFGAVFEQLLAEHRTPGPMSELVCRSLLHVLLGYLVRGLVESGQGSRNEGRRWSSPIERAFQAIEAREVSGDLLPDVRELAKVARMSEGAFRRRFEAEVGFTPLAYLNHRRIERAKRLLAARASVTTVAHELDFCSSQYFSTVFRKITGMTPSEYLSSHQA